MTDWDEKYRKGESPWDKGTSSPPMKQYLERHAVRGRALVPGCGRGHEVALAVEHGLDATAREYGKTRNRPAHEGRTADSHTRLATYCRALVC